MKEEFENLIRVLQEYGNAVQELYKQNLTNENAKASGELINSVKYIYEHNGNSYSISLSLAEYWKYVEYGRRAGAKFPPPTAIKKWIEVKPILPRPMKNGKLPTINQLTYLISRKIARDGIKPRNILKNTLEEINREYDEKISEALTLDLANSLDEVFALLVRR